MIGETQSSLDCDGAEFICNGLTVRELKATQRALRWMNVRSGYRKMLDLPWCRDLAFRLQHRIAAVRELNVVTCTLFEKHVGANWLVPPHQDLMLPATGEKFRVTSDGLRLRRGVPAELERAVAVRCHLDDCGESDGALRTKPRSHTLGILLADEVSEKTCELTWQTHVACAGDILLMKPLTVHASSKSSGRSRRRVLHFVFA